MKYLLMMAVDEERPLLKTLSGHDYYQSTASAETLVEEYQRQQQEQQKTVHNNNDSWSWLLQRLQEGRHYLLLLVVAVLYGTLNVALRGIYQQPDPPSAAALSAVRGWLAVACFVPLWPSRRRYSHKAVVETSTTSSGSDEDTGGKVDNTTTIDPSPQSLLTTAAELALWNFGAQGLINVGLTYTSAARAAFFTQLSVVLTPLLSAVAAAAAAASHSSSTSRATVTVALSEWWACGLALAGLILLSYNNGNSDDNNDDSDADAGLALNAGDILCLLGALSWSTYLFRLSAVGNVYPEVELQASKTLVLAMLYTTWCAAAYGVTGQAQWLGWHTGHGAVVTWMLLLYSAAGPGMLADVWQQKAQATVSATVANIVLSLEPVFTAMFARLLLGEETTLLEKVGGAFIFTAALVATTRDSS